MAITTIWTQEHIETLQAAILSCVLTVQYGGGATGSRTVTYQSLAEMRGVLAEARASVADAAGTRKSSTYATCRKGV